MKSILSFWSICLLCIAALFTACDKENLQNLNPAENTPTVQLKSDLPTVGNTTDAVIPGIGIRIGKASVHCTFPPCPCIAPFGYCDFDPWSPFFPGDPIFPGDHFGRLWMQNQFQLGLEFSAPVEQEHFTINNEHQLSAELADALGAEQITILPGEYIIDYSENENGAVYLNYR